MYLVRIDSIVSSFQRNSILHACKWRLQQNGTAKYFYYVLPYSTDKNNSLCFCSFVGQTKEKFHSVLFNKKLKMHQLSIAVPAPDVYSVYHTSEECFWRALIGWLIGD